ncbi:hypothetical protein O9K51_11440 [Purpureocillium lavendulum]|uniref:Uncharacterized protein n=1 Tax=Purpureocillium lavendulum TaxID=1247861 RepID=A0AB34FB67_9HYPO|nr:hypothetical protein O9K51_11440 [Purpureocillium lavendulum]
MFGHYPNIESYPATHPAPYPAAPKTAAREPPTLKLQGSPASFACGARPTLHPPVTPAREAAYPAALPPSYRVAAAQPAQPAAPTAPSSAQTARPTAATTAAPRH